jgi:hypothetical protein
MEGAAAVWLGYPGELVATEESPDIYGTRVGGAPVYPVQQPPPQAGAPPRCAVCGGPLSLVMQVGSAAMTHICQHVMAACWGVLPAQAVASTLPPNPPLHAAATACITPHMLM